MPIPQPSRWTPGNQADQTTGGPTKSKKQTDRSDLNWHLNKNVKANLDYDQKGLKGGEATDLLAKGEKAVFTRAQISF